MKTPLLIAAACLLALLSTVGAALPYPILPPLFAADVSNNLNHFLGLPPKLLFGIALSINPLGLLIGTALLGPMSDRYGRRPVLLASATGAALGHAITAWSLVIQNYPLFILARFVTGLLEGNASVARAMLADRLEGDLRVQALAWLNGAVYSGWLVGPLIAGMTLGFGITVPFWIATVALLLTAGMVAIALPKEKTSHLTTSWWQVARSKHAFNLLKVPELKQLFIIQLAYTSGVTAFYDFFPLWLVEVAGYHSKGIAWMTAGLCAVMALASLFAGRPSNVMPLRRVQFHAFCAAAAVAAVGLGNTWIGLIAIIAFGFPNAIYNALLPSWCSERFGHHGQGAVMGLISTTFYLANIMIALLGSILTLIDTRIILVFGALLSIWAARRIGHWRAELEAKDNAIAAENAF
ncbi:MFS transporter [Undibacterium sp. LX40W]|uniref:MFS transporter n=1 Tax=Undibacterium nitidum TaxID=2762298 RepID=A0A923HLE4_9BURK|nr:MULTISPECIES: MFS transporter [Undibacterium]MBC3881800.1 MFS transporter [Undibacterium nitidum]MBC3892203.1 MFS transporter [Undibacterium sp. LX40W]